MAGVNVSLLDLDDSPGKQLPDPLLPVVHSVPNSADSVSEVKVLTNARPVRTLKVSNIGKESQRNELAFSLYTSINRELRAVDAIFKKCVSGNVLFETLETCVAEIEAKADTITSEYVTLSQLSNNKVDIKINKHFEFFIGEIGKITQKILELKQDMTFIEEEKREQADLEDKKRLFEEEQRKFE